MFSYKCKISIEVPRLVHSYPKPKRIARRNILIDRLKKINVSDDVKISDVTILIPSVDKSNSEVTFIFTFEYDDTENFDILIKNPALYEKIVNAIQSIVKNFKI
jgi:hypothetical protein